MDDTTQAVIDAVDDLMATISDILAEASADDLGAEPTGALEALVAALPPPVDVPMRVRPSA